MRRLSRYNERLNCVFNSWPFPQGTRLESHEILSVLPDEPGVSRLAPGSQLGPYQIHSLLGSGGMGQVYKAFDARMGRDVAIKVAAERLSERFDREVRAIASLNHPNICTVYDVGPNYLVMELVDGKTLRDGFRGAVPVERWLVTGTRKALLGTALVGTAAVSAVVALPVLPVDQLERTPIADLNDDAIETVGWPELVRTVARVHGGLPENERASAIVFTANYGEAGAVDRFGPALGVPGAYSGHNAYARFGIPMGSTGPVIVLGYRIPPALLAGCRPVASIDNGVELENEEQGGTVFVCTGPRRPWAEIWRRLRHLDA